MSARQTLRCAIYTRKSTEEGLEQDFNSLDAQREACEAFIASQSGLGWKHLSTRYDDGGASGGTMDRPALQQLLNEIEAGRIDVVVVYKIDRLTRSLMDFAKIVDVFDAKNVSFVSVTQQFNTTTSMGRLTLNVLLSFAQFEREVTAERIRDKIAASRKKGMWMGGNPPLGYDVKEKQLVVNEAEADTVRRLFRLYLETRSVRRLKARADELGIVTKRRIYRDGRATGGKLFSRGNLHLLLTNPTYIGQVVHRDQTYPGLQQAIVDQALWDEVQAAMAKSAVDRKCATNIRSPSFLTGLIFDETGDRLSPSHAAKKGVRYRYYISHRLMQAARHDDDGWRLPAKELEANVLSALSGWLGNKENIASAIDLDNQTPSSLKNALERVELLASQLETGSPREIKSLLVSVLHRVEVHPDQLVLKLNLASLMKQLPGDTAQPESAQETDLAHQISVSHKLRRRGVEAKLVLNLGKDQRTPYKDEKLIQAVAKAHGWIDQLTNGSAASISAVAAASNEDRNEISRFLPLAFLAPDIIDAIMSGRQPIDLTLERIRRIGELPVDWQEQRSVLGF
ncbi:MAG: recombinase family protein [Pseudomonadota bacterium]